MRNLPTLTLSALTLLILRAPADATRAGQGNQMPAPVLELVPAPVLEPVLEVVSFRLQPAVSDADFLAAAAATGGPLQGQPGFVRRQLTRSADGTWTDLVEWTSLPQAQAAAEAMMPLPAFAPFLACIDPETIRMDHRPILWHMD